MDGLLVNKKLDVVDFDGIKLFMFRNDNLYDKFIPDNRKNQSLEEYFRRVEQNKNYPRPAINYQNCEGSDDPRNGLFVCLRHLIDNSIEFTVLDIGSHVGDFAIKCGNFFRDAGRQINVISFDPSPAGKLVPLNIEINGLTAINRHEDLAVTEFDGYYIFNFVEGESDSAKLTISKESSFMRKLKFYLGSSFKFKLKMLAKITRSVFKKKKKSFDSIVKGVSLKNYLQNNQIKSNLFIKVDVEGFDEVLVREIIKLKSDRIISLITELHVDDQSLSFLQEISEHFYIYDLFYCPNPTQFIKIEPNKFEHFINSDLKNREYGYTDLFLLDKKTPGVQNLMSKFEKLKIKERKIVLG